MAGGQQFAVEQGTLGASQSVALTGSAIAVSTGTLVVASLPVDIALTGTAVTSAVGTVGLNRIVPLRSRKGGGGATSRLLVGLGATIAQGTLAARPQSALLGQAVASAVGTLTTSRTRSLTGISIQIAQTSIGPSGSGTYDPADVVFTQGVANSSQLPLPSGYNAGGFYTLASGSLPTGVTLTVTGLLVYDGIGAVSATSATFSYTEPGALPTLLLESGAITGTLPYMATAYPTEGVVPAGTTIISVDDPSLRGSILSTWPDGSASVVVLAGHKSGIAASSSYPVSLQTATISDTALTPAFIDSLLTSVNANFGTPLSFSNFTSGYDKVWWANSQVICARYRLPITNKGSMEALFDIHAFANGRVLVEVVVENGNVDSDASTVPDPGPQTYTNATVAVNGVTFATVSSAHNVYIYNTSTLVSTPNHWNGKAWYASTWVGGDPQIEVTHDTAYLQAHPAFQKPAVASTVNMQTTYQNDVYEPWSTERNRARAMAGGGDGDGTIGHLTKWDLHYIQTGSKYARRSVIANALSMHSYNIHLRDNVTHAVPTLTQLDVGDKNWSEGSSTTLPIENVYGPGQRLEPVWEVAHHPAAGLTAFLCQPSPCFIEIAQKIANINATYSTRVSGGFSYWYQTRGKAWATRSLAHAIFLTPDGDPWKAPAVARIIPEATIINGWRPGNINNPLEFVWGMSPTATHDHAPTIPGYQYSVWEHFFLAGGWHYMARLKCAGATDQAAVDDLADWLMRCPVRYINEMTNGEWRRHGYRYFLGKTGNTTANGGVATANPDSESTYGLQVTWTPTNPGGMTGTPPVENGPWVQDPLGPPETDWQAPSAQNVDTVAWTSSNYVVNFWGCFCLAQERDIPGASAVWTRVVNGIGSNLPTWLAGFATNPTNGYYPRNR